MVNQNKLRELVSKELLACGVSPALLESMVTLVEVPSDVQKTCEEYYRVQIEKDQLERRYKFVLRKQLYLEKKIKVLEEKLNNDNLKLIDEMLDILNDIVWIDPTEMNYLEKLKEVQNKASWCVTNAFKVGGADNEQI